MIWPKRSNELELIDLGPPHYTEEEYILCLDKLDKIGQYLGGDRASLKELKRLAFLPTSILDVGCGGGGFTQTLGNYYPQSLIKGVDISYSAIQYANHKNRLPNVFFEQCRLEEIPSKSHDVVISTLVCHHFNDADLIVFLKNCVRVAKKKVIINDLHRHPVAWGFFVVFSSLLFKNRLITHDGALSIKRAFIRQDWNDYLKELDVKGKVSWRFPFRWILTLDPA